MKLKEFERAIKEQDFANGDTFWLNGIEFEVIGKRPSSFCIDCGMQESFCECEE